MLPPTPKGGWGERGEGEEAKGEGEKGKGKKHLIKFSGHVNSILHN